MTAWSNNLQNASYKSVAFDVLNINDSNGKALAEHGRPFAAGTDLEDMGTQGRQCQLTAVYFGIGFDSRLLKLINALEETGAGVLIHPILGVMQDMIAASWTFKTEADNVNYVTIDITFRETKESQPIFVFENAFLSKLEQILNTINNYTQQILNFVDTVMSIKNAVSAIWGSANGLYAALRGVVGSVRDLFDLDPLRHSNAGSFSQSSYQQDVSRLTNTLAEAVTEGLNNDSIHGTDSLNTKQVYDVLADRVDELNKIPKQILTAQDDVNQHVQQLTDKHMYPVAQALQLISISVLLQITVELIESDSDIITAQELIHINNDLRRRIQQLIEALRATHLMAEQANSQEAASIYTQATITISHLKNAASQLNGLIMAVINQKPPMRVKRAGLDGTLHQIAHAFYGDRQRADELMRLNPHLNHPAFIKRSDWINYYVK